MDKLWKIANNPDSHLKNMILRKVTNIYGTRLYLININYELKAIIRDLNGQTLFFIASIVDI